MTVSVDTGVTYIDLIEGISMDDGISYESGGSSNVINALLFGLNNVVLLSIDNYILMPT